MIKITAKINWCILLYKNSIRKLLFLLSRSITSLNGLLSKLNYKITRNAYNPNPNAFEDLAPVESADKGNGYSDAILWALKNENIRNIAVSGPYGSGKSSVLKTFINKHSNYRYLNISLASFASESVDGEKKNKKEDKENERFNTKIEKSILQQIFYQVNKSDAPASRLKRISDVNKSNLIAGLIGLVMWLSAVFLLYKPDQISSSYLSKVINFNVYEYIPLLAVAVFLGLYYLIRDGIRLIGSLALGKISTIAGALEFNEKIGESILNKHLDEILYFFSSTKYDVVIIEDLDRHDEINIFSKLREINDLINKSEQVGRKIVFVYAIKDDFFKGNDRTKFFDYILPVIPVINSSNSRDIFLAKLEKANLLPLISKEFLYVVTLYVSDMRMLKNIYNEFVIYRSKLSSIDLEYTNLLGFIVYKNLFPADYAKLNNNDGIVAETFKKKAALAEKYKINEEEQLAELSIETTAINNEKLKSIKELRAVYLCTLIGRVNNFHSFNINGNRVSLNDAMSDEYFNLIRLQTGLQYINHAGQSANFGVGFSGLENEVDPRSSYIQRMELLNRKLNGDLELNRKKIKDSKEKIRKIDVLNLKEFLDVYPNTDLFCDIDLDNKGLLEYLLKNGYIDEMYHSFISFFYEGGITKKDIDFILSVKNKRALPIYHEISNIAEILDRLNYSEFNRPETLNIHLFDYMLNTIGEKVEMYVGLLVEQLCNKRPDSVRFIDEYRINGKYSNILAGRLCKSCHDFWSYIEFESGFSEDKANEYLFWILESADSEDILKLNLNGVLSDYISSRSDFLKLASSSKIKHEKLEKILTSLKVKFESINNITDNVDLFKFIRLNKLYEINQSMMKVIVNYDTQNSLDFTPSYSSLIKSQINDLVKYVRENMEKYIGDVYLGFDGDVFEDEHGIKELLANEDLTDDIKCQIINKATFVIDDVEAMDCTVNVWSCLMERGCVTPSWSNIAGYYDKVAEIDDVLIAFMNALPSTIEDRLILWPMDDEQLQIEVVTLVDILCANEFISEPAVDLVVKSIADYVGDISIENVPHDRYEMMLKHNVVALKQKNIDILESVSSEYCSFLLINHLDEYASSVENYVVGLDVTGLLIDSSLVSDNIKHKIINNVKPSEIGKSSYLAKSLYNYSLLGSSVFALKYDLLRELISQHGVDDGVVNIVSSQVEFMTPTQVEGILGELGGNYSEIGGGKRPVINNTEANLVLVNALKTGGFITSFSIVEKGIRVRSKKN